MRIMNLTTDEIIETLGNMYDGEILLADGFEEALLGYVEGWFPCDGGVSRGVVAMYDTDLCIKILMDRDGMDAGEASEFFSFNVTGAYVGDKSPVFATFLREKTDDSSDQERT
jgi:hypothetical protein